VAGPTAASTTATTAATITATTAATVAPAGRLGQPGRRAHAVAVPHVPPAAGSGQDPVPRADGGGAPRSAHPGVEHPEGRAWVWGLWLRQGQPVEGGAADLPGALGAARCNPQGTSCDDLDGLASSCCLSMIPMVSGPGRGPPEARARSLPSPLPAAGCRGDQPGHRLQHGFGGEPGWHAHLALPQPGARAHVPVLPGRVPGTVAMSKDQAPSQGSPLFGSPHPPCSIHGWWAGRLFGPSACV